MRTLVILLLTAGTCRAQADQSQAEALLKQMEGAEQRGDFNTWANLWSREKSGDIEKMRKYIRPRPEVRYRALKTYVRGDAGVILVQTAGNSFATFKLGTENGQWKIQDQVWTQTAPDANSVYALVPPADGAFVREGARWEQVGAALDSAKAARLGWQMRAVFDESFLYIRIESNEQLPAPGSTIAKPPGGWPVLKIDTSSAGEFVLYDAVNVGDQATFDVSGSANSHRAFAAYIVRLERNGREVFTASADLKASPLLAVSGRDYDIRIPLASMGIADSRATRITIGDAQWPKSAIVSLAVPRYPR